MMKLSVVALVLAVLVVVDAARPAAADGYYDAKNCAGVEGIVREVVDKTLAVDRSKGAALVRLFFHDCWVHGCEGSVLLDASPLNPSPEKAAPANIGLGAFDVIEKIKARLEAVCPGVVSCADILAFAGRDAARFLSNGHIDYNLTSGRLDGVVSVAADAQATLPDSKSSFADLKKNFDAKGFDVEELVVLSGAHSIGQAHLQSFDDRLTAPSDQIDPRYRKALNLATLFRPVVKNDVRDENALFRFVAGYNVTVPNRTDFLNNTYYHNALADRVLFRSDQQLRTDTFAESKLVEYRDDPKEWDSDFTDAMIKLSKLPAEGKDFEIRKTCSCTNKQHGTYSSY